LRGNVMDHQNESNNRSRLMFSQCESLRRCSMEHYGGVFLSKTICWSHNACVQLGSEQPITNNFVSQTVVARFSEHFVTVDEL